MSGVKLRCYMWKRKYLIIYLFQHICDFQGSNNFYFSHKARYNCLKYLWKEYFFLPNSHNSHYARLTAISNDCYISDMYSTWVLDVGVSKPEAGLTVSQITYIATHCCRRNGIIISSYHLCTTHMNNEPITTQLIFNFFMSSSPSYTIFPCDWYKYKRL